MKNNHQKLSVVLLAIFITWILLSLARTANNFSKIYTEDLSWMYLNDDQKKEKVFGEIYDFFKLLEANTEDRSEIAFLTTDIRAYYLSKYYLYPRIVNVYRIDKKDRVNLKDNTYITVFVENPSEQDREKVDLIVRGHKKIANINKDKVLGEIYKL